MRNGEVTTSSRVLTKAMVETGRPGAAACVQASETIKRHEPAKTLRIIRSLPNAHRFEDHSFLSRLPHSENAKVEAIFNLGTLGRNDTTAAPMSDLFSGGIP